MRKRVLILCNYPFGVAPGQRFRFEQYFKVLADAGIETTVEPFFQLSTWQILYKPGYTARKAWAVVSGFARRFWSLRNARKYDYVFVVLEAAPIGPPLIEWCLFFLNCRVVYDIDDVIFMSRTSEANRLVSRLRWRSKIAYICRNSVRVTACNKFLKDWAAQFNPHALILPTTIDSNHYKPDARKKSRSRPVIGWTGSHSNIPYLEIVLPALLELQQRFDFELQVICNVAPNIQGLRNYKFVKWSGETEVENLSVFDIGLMPVPDDLWAKGKVGLKAIQYSALEIVPVASDVGSGPEVIIDGTTGFLVKNTKEDWYRALAWLLDHPGSWESMGRAARAHILATYSVTAQAPAYVGLFA